MLHRSLPQGFSKPFDALIDGHTKEEQNGMAKRKDGDAATFEDSSILPLDLHPCRSIF